MNEAGPSGSKAGPAGVVLNNRIEGHVRDYDTEHPSWGQTAEATKDHNCIHKFNFSVLSFPDCLLTPDLAKLLLPWKFGCRSLLHALTQLFQVAWQAILKRPFVSGGFTWTGWDYRGEPTPYSWPDVNSHFGILDVAGFWKHRAHWYFSCWTPSDSAVLHLLPHWNWKASPSCSTKVLVDVWVYSNLEEVELIHPNGTSLGRQKSSQCSHVEWPSVPYMPGVLSAHGYLGGKVVKTSVVRTTGSPSALRIGIIDGVGADGIVANGQDVGLVFVEVIDDNGDVVPTASNMISVSAQTGAQGIQMALRTVLVYLLKHVYIYI